MSRVGGKNALGWVSRPLHAQLPDHCATVASFPPPAWRITGAGGMQRRPALPVPWQAGCPLNLCAQLTRCTCAWRIIGFRSSIASVLMNHVEFA